MANDSRAPRHRGDFAPRPSHIAPRSGGTRFRSDTAFSVSDNGDRRRSDPYAPSGRTGISASYRRPAGERFASHAQDGQNGVVSPYSRGHQAHHSPSPVAVVIGILAALAIIVGFATVVFPSLFGMSGSSGVEPGQQVSLTIPEGASGDTIASILSEHHVVEEPSAYYAAVKKLRAEASLKPGDYRFLTGQDPVEVVKQLVDGPNVEGLRLTVPEGKTLEQTASIVEESLGIPASDFIAQAKASNYEQDYPFVAGAYNNSLEGFLFPKTYELASKPTADKVIRVMLDQFKREVLPTGYERGANGLSPYEILSMAALIERETAVIEERPTVASVIYNRIEAKMPLQIDAAIVYARGGGNGIVTYDDLEIDSPYNIYKNQGLTPGPICNPSLSSIQAALEPGHTDYVYYVASAKGDGTHRFTSNYDEFLRWSDEYNAAIS